jgi:hypothetical protein
MKQLYRVNFALKIFIYARFDLFIIFFSILSMTAILSCWWLSYLSVAFFIWNIFNERKYLGICIIFLCITLMLNAFNFLVLRPVKQNLIELHAKWNKIGYNEFGVDAAQEALNVVTRSIEEYKVKNGVYPKTVSEIQYISDYSYDLSYSVRQQDGQAANIPFYYEQVDTNKFFLAGVGKDGLIRTQDDLLPQIAIEQEKNTGLSKYIIKQFSQEELEQERKLIKMFKKGEKVEKILNDSVFSYEKLEKVLQEK